MITCNLKGGLGNMMFQIAAIKSMAKDNGVLAYFHNVQSHIHDLNSSSASPCQKYANRYYDLFAGINLGENLQYGFKPSNFVSVPFAATHVDFVDNTCYDGFFQTEKFFAHNRDYVLDMFRFNDEVHEMASHIYGSYCGSSNTCAIHVHKRDYLEFSNLHPMQPMSYYRAGIDAVGKVDAYLVFSDDVEWCKNNFSGENYVFIKNDRDYLDLAITSMCTHHITCNSSFSWWGAWLNNGENKIVVGPKKWFGDHSMKNPESGFLASSNILPESWIKI
jgi:hypothetical protein